MDASVTTTVAVIRGRGGQLPPGVHKSVKSPFDNIWYLLFCIFGKFTIWYLLFCHFQKIFNINISVIWGLVSNGTPFHRK